jgi:geranylgeranyl diphosphate synthase type II
MRYSLLAGGKRLRPILCIATNEILGGKFEDVLPLACAVECIHTYSLIHDDLPCMDNDDLRRGKPTCHKVFGDGIAVLAGDALLTVAFELAAGCAGWPLYSASEAVVELARASGSLGLIAGQVLDLEGEGRSLCHQELRGIHERKTGALIATSIRLGAMSANASAMDLDILTRFGKALGLAFQVIDDILDITQPSEQLGKSAGKDVKAEKATYPAILGLEGAQEEAARLTRDAKESLAELGERGRILSAISDLLLNRRN